MTYSQQTWVDGQGGGTPISAARLNHMEAGIAAGGGATLPWFNVLSYGAVGDGITDDSAAIQAAIDASHIGPHFTGLGGAVYFPYGKYYVATGLTSTNPGTQFIGQGGPGISDELSTGSTQIIVGDGIWGLTVGTSGTSDFRGFNVENLHFFEKNTGQAAGGLRIFSSSNGSYTKVSAGRFTAGTGILLDGVSDPVQAQYNQFSDCRVGKCLIGFEQRHANGTRWIGGYADGSHNGQTPTASTVGFKITSGDTFRSIGTVIQGYDTLIDIGSGGGTCFDAEFQNVRMEVWGTAAIRVRASVASAKFHGGGDNSLNSNSGTGAVIDSGATDTVMGAVFTNVKALYTDNGTRTRYPATSGLAKGAAVAGTLVGQFPQYDNTGTLIGYAPLYDSITGIYLKAKLGGTVNNATGVTTVVRTLTSPVNVGDMVLIGGGYGSASTVTVTVTDSRSNTWTVNRHDDMATGATPHSFVVSSVLTTALQVGDTITATFSGNVNYPMIFAYDYAGQIAGTILDTSGGATGTSTSPSTGNITTTTDYPLLFSAAYFDVTATFTAGTGFTSQDNQTSTSKTVNIETMNGPQAATFVGASGTLSSSVDWAMTVVAFKKVAGGSPPALPSQTGNSGKYLTTNGTTASWGTVAAGALTNSSNILSADVTMTTNGTYYDGPTLTLAAGTWLLIGAAQLLASSSAIRTWVAKLWDGTNSPVCVGTSQIPGTAAAGQASLSVAAIVSPGSSTTYKISATSTVNADTFRGTSTTGSYLIAVKVA